MGKDPSDTQITQVVFPEVIDEQVDFNKLFAENQTLVRVDCRDVKRINSVGIRSLTSALTRLRRSGTKFIFAALTPPLVEAIEFVSNLLPPKSEIETVYVPYYCHSCKNHFQVLYTLPEIVAKQSSFEVLACTKCGKNAEIDHVPELYFKNLLQVSGKKS